MKSRLSDAAGLPGSHNTPAAVWAFLLWRTTLLGYWAQSCVAKSWQICGSPNYLKHCSKKSSQVHLVGHWLPLFHSLKAKHSMGSSLTFPGKPRNCRNLLIWILSIWLTFYHPIPVKGSIAVTGHRDQKSPGEDRVYFSLRLVVHYPGKLEPRGGSWSRSHRGMWLVSKG